MNFIILFSSIFAAFIAAYAFFTQEGNTVQFPLPSGDPRLHALQCCDALNTVVPGKVSFPGQSDYEIRQKDFYAGTQSSLRPRCRVFPDDASDVSEIMKVATTNQCKFSVVSGGHMSWDSSNIDATGFNLDLAKINSVSLSEDKKVASIRPGARWGDVYRYLLPHDLIVAGGRASGVGVGGFLLGGGVSFLSFREGWASATILGYEVVLSNGTIVEVNQNERDDLYHALKFASTNYGIVTRFDLATFETGDIWGGTRFHLLDDMKPLLEHLEYHTHAVNKDPTAFTAVGLAWSSAMKQYLVWSPMVSLASPDEWPATLSGLKTIGQAVVDTTRRMTYTDMTDEIHAGFPGGKRVMWWSLNIKMDKDLVWDMGEHGMKIFEPLLNTVPGIEWDLVAQPIPVSMIKQSKKNGGDLSGLDESDGNQWLLLGAVFWDDEADDMTAKGKLSELLKWCEATASERGKLVRFIYPNYAAGIQDVMGGLGPDSVKLMKKVQRAYDPQLLLPKYWKGGFRL